MCSCKDLSWLKQMADKSDVGAERVKVGVKCQMGYFLFNETRNYPCWGEKALSKLPRIRNSLHTGANNCCIAFECKC